MRAAPFLLFALVALVAVAFIACKQSTPQVTPAQNTAGDAQIEKVFDQQFPENDSTTYSDDFDSLDQDLAMS